MLAREVDLLSNVCVVKLIVSVKYRSFISFYLTKLLMNHSLQMETSHIDYMKRNFGLDSILLSSLYFNCHQLYCHQADIEMGLEGSS